MAKTLRMASRKEPAEGLNNSDDDHPRVYVTQYIRNLDFAEANKWGEVTFLSSAEYRPVPCPVEINRSITANIKFELAKYVAGRDFIITTGSSIPNVVVGSLLRMGEHNVLKWSGMRKTYELFKVRI